MSAAPPRFLSSRQFHAYCIAASFIAVLSFNVLLVIQNRALKLCLAEPTPELIPRIGSRFPVIQGSGPRGSHLSISFANRTEPSLLLVFSPDCMICQMNWPMWQLLGRDSQMQARQITYANVGPPINVAYAAQHGLTGATLLTEVDPEYQAEYNLRLTPQTILLTQSGTVERVWIGLLNEKDINQIIDSFRPTN